MCIVSGAFMTICIFIYSLSTKRYLDPKNKWIWDPILEIYKDGDIAPHPPPPTIFNA